MVKKISRDTNEPASRNFEKTFGEYGPKLRRFLSFRVRSDVDAQDLAQEAYFRLCRVKEPDLIREPDAYLFRIASNLANEFLLKKSKQPPLIDIDGVGDTIGEKPGDSFGDHIEQRSEILKLQIILDELPPLYQAILLLRKRDGYSHQEIAERLDISPHTVHKYLKRALLKCRTAWVE